MWRKALKYSLLAFVAVSVATVLWQQARIGSPEAEAAAAPAPAPAAAEAAVSPGNPGENKILSAPRCAVPPAERLRR